MDLKTFFAALDQHSGAVPMDELVDLLGALDVTRDDVEHRVAFDPDHYKRNLIHLGDAHAALVLCWSPGQASPIHDHRGSACGVKVIQGTLSETRYRHLEGGGIEPMGQGQLEEGAVCGSCDQDTHVIENCTDTDLITLHVYTPPLQNFHIWCRETGKMQTISDEETLEAQRRLRAGQPIFA